MKKLLVILMIVMSVGATSSSQAQFPGSISFNTFYTELSPYGRWINYPQYGQIWVANQQGFEPYYDNGHWDYTSYGWTWISDYPWGWAPFHYGRWAHTSYGWAWIPGYDWAPAWVSWAQNDGYYGWAPLGPGIGFNIGFNSIPRNRWRFVQQQYINSPRVWNHYVRPDRSPNVYNNVTVINNTQVINNNTYAAGPQRAAVERVIRKTIVPKEVAFTESTQPTRVEKNQVRMYRPAVKAQPQTDEQTAAQPATTGRPSRTIEREQNLQPVTKDNKGAANPGQQPVPVKEKTVTATPSNGRPAKAADNPAVRKEQLMQQKIAAQQERQRAQQEAVRQQQEQQPKATSVPQPGTPRRAVEPANSGAQQNDTRQQQLNQDRIRQQQAAQQAKQQANEARAQQLQQQRASQQQEAAQQNLQRQQEAARQAKQQANEARAQQLQQQRAAQQQEAAQQNLQRRQEAEQQARQQANEARAHQQQAAREQRQNELRQQQQQHIQQREPAARSYTPAPATPVPNARPQRNRNVDPL